MIGNSCSFGCSNVQNAFCNAEFTCACVPGYSVYNGTCQSGKPCLEGSDENILIQFTVVVSSTDNSNKCLGQNI